MLMSSSSSTGGNNISANSCRKKVKCFLPIVVSIYCDGNELIAYWNGLVDLYKFPILVISFLKKINLTPLP